MEKSTLRALIIAAATVLGGVLQALARRGVRTRKRQEHHAETKEEQEAMRGTPASQRKGPDWK